VTILTKGQFNNGVYRNNLV